MSNGLVSAAHWTDRMNDKPSTVTLAHAPRVNERTNEALLTRRQESADHKDKVCQVGVTVNTELVAIALGFDRLFLVLSTHPQSCPAV